MAQVTWKKVARQFDRLYEEGSATGCSDDQLLSRFTAVREESELAFEAIVRWHGPMVLEVCRCVLGDRHAAEDAMQSTFLVLARRAGSIAVRSGGSLGPWLYGVAYRTAREARRSAMRRRARERRAAERAGEIVKVVNPVGLEDDDRCILHEEVARLPEKYRKAIVLCYFEGRTHDQAAETLRWPVGTVRGYLARARALLRSRLVGRGMCPAVAVSLLNSRSEAATAVLAPTLVDSVLRVITQRSAGSTVAVLAGTNVRRQAIFRAGRTLRVFLAFALGTGGAGWIGLHLGWPGVGHGLPRKNSAIVAVQAGVPVARRHVDLYGDPLPDGAVARLGTYRFNHAENVYRVDFTPDGKAIISQGSDGLARVWDATSGRLLRTIGGKASRGSRLFALSPDGKRIASAERTVDGAFHLWDFETGRELYRSPLPMPKGAFLFMGYSPDGKTLATARFDNALWFRDAETFNELERITVNFRGSMQFVYSPDGRMLAATSDDTEPQHRRMRFDGVAGGVRGLPRAPEHDNAVERASIHIWDVGQGKEVQRLAVEGGHANSVTFAPDGKILAAPFCDATIRLYDPASGNELGRIKVDGPMQGALVFSPDGRFLASGDNPLTQPAPDDWEIPVAKIHIWDVARRDGGSALSHSRFLHTRARFLARRQKTRLECRDDDPSQGSGNGAGDQFPPVPSVQRRLPGRFAFRWLGHHRRI